MYYITGINNIIYWLELKFDYVIWDSTTIYRDMPVKYEE